MSAERVPWLAYACLAGSMALVGGYVATSRLLVAALPVFLLAWMRFGIAALAMPHWLRRPTDEPALTAADRRLVFLESFLGNFLFSICMLYGVSLTSAVAAGVTMAAIPAAVALLSWAMLGERIGWRIRGSIVLAVAGIALLALARAPAAAGATSHASGTPAGWLLGHGLLVGAVLCEAFYVVAGKRLSAKLSPRRISALINLWGLALMTPLGLWQALHFDFAAPSASTWTLLVFYAIAASIVSVWLWMRGLQDVPAARAGVFSVLLPASAAGVGVFVLDEPFGRLHGLSLALALGGLLLATWPARSAGSKKEVRNPSR